MLVALDKFQEKEDRKGKIEEDRMCPPSLILGGR